MAINVTHSKVSTIPDGDDTSLIRPSDWNDDHVIDGLGTMAEQNANAVAITGGTISGVAVTGYVPTTTTIATGTGLTGGGDLSANRTIALANTAVTAGTYGSDSRSITQVVDAQGRLTNIYDQPIAIANTQVSGLGTASTKDAGVALGVATLDAGGTVPLSQIPASIIGGLNYQGTWNASTNTPTLTSSVGTKGYYYAVSVSGTTNLNGITDWFVGDLAVFDGSAWQQIDNTDAVTSVNGFTGTVVLTTTNVAEGTNEYFTTAKARTSISAGTAISYNNSTGVITNSAPDQTVALTAGTGISTSGTYPNFTITNTAPSSGGTVTSVGGTGTVSGISLSGTVTSSGNLTLGGTLDLSAPPVIGGTTPNTITGTTINADTKVVSPDYYAQSILGGNLRTSGGTSLLNWDGGGSGNITVNGGLTANPANKNISLSPSGTGSVTISPATAGAMNNVVIGATTPLAITGTTVTATTFSGSGASLTGVVTSVTGTAPVVSSGGATPAISMAAATGSVNGYLTSTDWTTFNNKQPAGTYVTSVTGTAPVVSSGGTTPAISLASGYGDTQNPYASKTANYVLAAPNGSTGAPTFRAIVAADIPTLNQNTTGSAGSVANALTAGTGLTATATFNGSAAVTFNATGTTINSQTSAYTLVAGDAGKAVSITTGGVTINNSVMSAGNIVTIYNNSGSSQTITQGSGVTLQWAGQTSSTTGNRTLGLYGMASILFISASTAVITGVGLT